MCFSSSWLAVPRRGRLILRQRKGHRATVSSKSNHDYMGRQLFRRQLKRERARRNLVPIQVALCSRRERTRFVTYVDITINLFPAGEGGHLAQPYDSKSLGLLHK
jgi:hypothetical protein